MHWLVHAYVDHWKFVLLAMAAVLFAGIGANTLGPYIASKFEIGEEWAALGCFVAILAGAAWIYDQYQRWRFFRSDKP
jgi:hypothetical protein